MLAKSSLIVGTTAAIVTAGMFASAFNMTTQSDLSWSDAAALPEPIAPPGACGLPSNNWHLGGNRGSDPDLHYLGTGDSVDLVVKTDCDERIRVLATGETLIHFDLFVGGDLSVDGATTLADLKVENDLSVQGNLSVDGHSSLATMNASGNATFQQNISVSGASNLNTLNAQGAASLNSTLSVSGNSAFASDVDVSGTTRTAVLEILGADLAEEFPFSAPVQPGMVVEIDPENPGQLRPATGAYSRRVAGIVAGANEFSTGVVLGRGSGNEFAAPVALSGRVYVYVDATDRAVEVGDMLTSSDSPGYAMAVRDCSRVHGAVIGKAMTPMPQGQTGMVLVLVNLQ
jgi:hypothetical protein